MSQFDNNMQVIVSKVVSDNPNAPTLRVQAEINGTKHQAGVWLWKRKDGSLVKDKNGNGQYIGTLEIDDYKPQDTNVDRAAASPPPAPADDFDDDVPF